MTGNSRKKCEKEECDKTASFVIDWQKPLFCASHKLKSKHCETEGCDKIASFGTEGKKTHCKKIYIVKPTKRMVSRIMWSSHVWVVDLQ
jgi:riboflavin synthase